MLTILEVTHLPICYCTKPQKKKRKETIIQSLTFLFSYLAAATVWFGATVAVGRWSISGASKKYAKQPTESSV